MKIAIFAPHPIQYHIPWFQELSQRAGYDVKVYFASVPDAVKQGAGFDVAFNWDVPLFEGYDFKVLENTSSILKKNGFFSCLSKGIRNVLQQERPDIVILTGWQVFPLLQALFWTIILRIPRIVRGESNGLKPRSLKVQLVHRLLLPWYNGFLTIGKANRQFYKGYGVREQKMFSCPYFVDNKRFLAQAKQSSLKRNEYRAQWSIPDTAVCFVYVGKLIAKKRIQDQLAALEIALKHNGNLHLLIVGTGELMDFARKKVKDQELPVSFTGFLNQTEITMAYVAADCLILSSDYDETWGLVVNEAMVCGLPAIVSDRAGSGLDLIEEEVTGTLYPFGNIPALADKILGMAQHPESMHGMGKKAQQIVLQNYNVEKAVRGTLEAVECVAG
jgi:glycosyltransferase involved in cell wall biosynthesis